MSQDASLFESIFGPMPNVAAIRKEVADLRRENAKLRGGISGYRAQIIDLQRQLADANERASRLAKLHAQAGPQ